MTKFSVAPETNFGAEPPIGSKIFIAIKLMKTGYLNAGTGLDWAGQVRAMAT